MLLAIGKSAYDTLKVLEWSFPRGHHFIWEKGINRVTVDWGDNNKVIFYPDTMEGQAYVDGQLIADDRSTDMIQTAWRLFANDSFWLVAPFKIRDPGTSRALVESDRGIGLLVTYSSGGVTPGDSYLWILDKDYKPIAWQMWVSIIPVDGLEFTWEGGNYYHGAWLAPIHKGPGPANVDLVIHQVK